ncbi:MAG: flagellar hook capping FlgD N-terminal domain-containing protein [Dehalococcoidia bacterium]
MGISGIGTTLADITMPVVQRTSARDMNQQDFLKIMIEQLKGQNPLDSGQDPNAFFSQMLQFQSMDAMTSMQKAIANLTQVSGLANASAMIGKTVTGTVAQTNDPETGLPRPDKTVTGKVASATFGDQGALLTLDSNVTVNVSKVTAVK